MTVNKGGKALVVFGSSKKRHQTECEDHEAIPIEAISHIFEVGEIENLNKKVTSPDYTK